MIARSMCPLAPTQDVIWINLRTIRSDRSRRAHQAAPRTSVTPHRESPVSCARPRCRLRNPDYESSILLDAKEFKGFLEHCDRKLECKLSAHSPEIKREMSWLDHGRAKMENLLNLRFPVASHGESQVQDLGIVHPGAALQVRGRRLPINQRATV